VFTARYALSPYIKQIRFAFKGLIQILDVFVALCREHFTGHIAIIQRHKASFPLSPGNAFLRENFNLRAFLRRVRIGAKGAYYLRHVHPSVRVCRRGCHWPHFREFLC
jgi:hypothetical protein